MLAVKLSSATSGLMPASVCAAASVFVMPACSGRKNSRFMLASSTCALSAWFSLHLTTSPCSRAGERLCFQMSDEMMALSGSTPEAPRQTLKRRSYFAHQAAAAVTVSF